MLSILIPTYNYVCAHLVCDLQKQCEEAQALLGKDFQYEIIVADDGSTDVETVEKNVVIDLLPNCRFIDNDSNVGRSAIRNSLIRQSHGKWILIIDADAEVIADDFIMRYVEATHYASDIIVGGLVNPPSAPDNCSLRYRYELSNDRLRSIEARQKAPAMFFSTFNFMAGRHVFEQLQFDERCTEYGYEDALFGIEADLQGFSICHIDNPLQHNGINDNVSFLHNTETALRTLYHLGPPMTDYARVAKTAHRLSTPAILKCTVIPPILLLYKMSRILLRRNLLSRHPNLYLFAFYKLGYYLNLQTVEPSNI